MFNVRTPHRASTAQRQYPSALRVPTNPKERMSSILSLAKIAVQVYAGAQIVKSIVDGLDENHNSSETGQTTESEV